MKKTLFLFVLISGIAVLFSSCSSTYNINFNQENPADQNTTITFNSSTDDGYFHFKEWNGISITDTVYKNRSVSSIDKVILTLPAGNTVFLFDLAYTLSNRYSSYTYRFEDFEFKYLFEPGKKYEIKGRHKTLALGFKGIEFYLAIYDITNGSELLQEWMVGKT